MYYLANWRKLKSGQEVAGLPHNVGYLLLASPCYEPKFSVFECEIKEPVQNSNIEKVSDEIFGLIESAKHFPPALAIGRNEVVKQLEKDFKTHPTRKEFLKIYQQVLENLLQRQFDSTYFICKAIDTESGYLYKGDVIKTVSRRR